MKGWMDGWRLLFADGGMCIGYINPLPARNHPVRMTQLLYPGSHGQTESESESETGQKVRQRERERESETVRERESMREKDRERERE